MQVVYERCCGVDVHKKTVVACVVTPAGRQTKTFTTMTRDLQHLVGWLQEQGVTHVAMESTGVFTPPAMLLRSCGGGSIGRRSHVPTSAWVYASGGIPPFMGDLPVNRRRVREAPMGNRSHPTQKHLAVTIRFEPTRFAPDTLHAAYACLLPSPRRKIRAARDRLSTPPGLAGGPAEGAGDEYVAGGPVRAGVVRATG